MTYEQIAEQLARAFECEVDDILTPAEETDIDSLAQLGLPPSVIDFYREHAPIETLDLGDVRFWSIPQLIEENQNYSPGAEVHDLGYVVIAANRKGDVYCLDLGISGDEDLPAVVFLPNDVRVGSRDRNLVEGQAKPVADTFDDFLEQFASGEISG